MSVLTIVPTTVTDMNGVRELATIAECECGCRAFYFLTIFLPGEGAGHPHIQCTGCGVSYCPGGDCRGPDDQSPGRTSAR